MARHHFISTQPTKREAAHAPCAKRNECVAWQALAVAGIVLVGLLVARLDAADSYEAGKVYFGQEEYIEYQAGALPLIIASPHGGRLKPEELPDRTSGTFAFDTNTQELARAIAAAMRKETGQPIHVVICRVHRAKLDCNREEQEGAGGNELAARAWREYHGFLDSARKQIADRHQRGLFIDLHGHGHLHQHVEVGYLHSRDELLVEDEMLNRAELTAVSGLRALTATSKSSYAQLVRGPTSFGGLLEKNGIPATPSPRVPKPPYPYFSGRYSTERHGRDAAPLCGLQLETHWLGVRDSAESRERFAHKFAAAVREFLTTHLQIELPKAEVEKSRDGERQPPEDAAPLSPSPENEVAKP